MVTVNTCTSDCEVKIQVWWSQTWSKWWL